jgi:hypothetical protein
MHVGGSFHDTFHPSGVRPPEYRAPSDATPRSSSQTTAPDASRDASPVLRLRGGGNAQGSGDKGGDRENLLPGGAGSGSHRADYGTRSSAQTQRAANEAKRYELRSSLERAMRDRDAARAARERAITALDQASAQIKDLDARKQQSGLDPARKSDIEAQLLTAHADFWRRTREVSDCTTELRRSDDRCSSLERKLGKLRLT